MRLIDLFCGAGGCTVGYLRGGFTEAIGVDHVPMPEYPAEFVRGDALRVLEELIAGGSIAGRRLSDFDLIHASPPCKLFTPLNRRHRDARLFEPDANLITPTLELLAQQPVPWVVENVPGSPLPNAVTLCGSMFGLRVRRHRLFAASFVIPQLECRHVEQGPPVGVYGNGGAWTRTAPGGGGVKVAGADAADALGIDWTINQAVLSQAIPPTYTTFIANALRGVDTR